MSKSLRKIAAKQQSRIAALNTLGTPGSSRAGSEVEDELDYLSDTSCATADTTASVDDAALEDDLRRCIDDLGEKRTSTREAALTTLNRILAHHYCGFFVSSNNQESLLHLLMRSISKPGSTREAVLATKGIALVFTSHNDISGGEEDDMYRLVLPLLKSNVVHALDHDLKYQSITTLAVVTFIAASDADTRGAFDYFYKLLLSGGANLQPEDENEAFSSSQLLSLVEATLRAYGLLYASAYGDKRGDLEDAWDELHGVMPVHLDLLESTSKDVRVAAGENIALMFESVQMLKRTEIKTEQNADDPDPEYEEMDELIDALQRLATESNRSVNKQDRKQQRGAFRDIVRSVESGKRPREKLKMGRHRLNLRGWEMQAFRNLFGQGLARHLEVYKGMNAWYISDYLGYKENEILQGVFLQESDDESDDGMLDEEEEVGSFSVTYNAGENDSNLLSPTRALADRREKAKRMRRRGR
ncbi:hypothetical protein DFQ28_006440 [Apophysomyces sp. BC1034]|nr:hypothetical protein DFQ30_006879 [Apophysomyces sp. BC1015]KAG0177070.1 hypothetical protein DFQ29_005291 [Apophysomyces sp. BC1021]KAG0187356.1 hypothetical protein DFQ28_006440 [Apophysomyces sp. BC1034]